MYKKAALLTFYAETPIHMGSGQSVSYVDLPIQRERHTSFPVLWASGIKGVIRNLALREWNDKDKVNTIFGPDPEDASDFASCIGITDAKILLYPVRSVKGVFAWITCPFVLKRFKEDLKAIGVDFKVNGQEIQIPETSDNKVIIANGNLIIQEKNIVALEEFLFEPEVKDDAKNWAKKLKEFIPTNDLTNGLENHLAIVSDNVFKDFVNYAVEIRTRIRIDQAKGTVKEGALFSEELIPSESVFYSLVFITDPYFEIEMDLYNELKSKKEKNEKPDWDAVKNRLKGSEDAKKKVLERLKKAWENGYFVDDEIKNSLKFLDHSLLQLGGDETIGRGLVRVKFYSLQGGWQ
jgi:CRISPR-associated protein Cmr4